jgi:hypothetical protein
MCERAAAVQGRWPNDDGHIHVCKRGDYSEDVVRLYCQLTEEEKRKAKTEYFWIPIDPEFSEYVFRRLNKNNPLDERFNQDANKYTEDQENREHFMKYFSDPEERRYAMLLAFFMKRRGKEWDDEREDWVRINRK